MKAIEFILLILGAMLGAYARYKITSFPAVFGIIGSNVIIVNIIGSFILGVFSNLSVSLNLDPKYSFLIAIGFCGTLTTMSSFALESVTMFDNKQLFQMTINVLSNVFLSLLSVYMGRILISQILGNINGS
ncbi:MAG TPA: fluoride efflux transporter CrcB [Candidatus Nitrosocosmicus sp.]